MNLLPRQPLCALAEQVPLVVMQQRVYLLSDEPGHKQTNCLRFDGHAYPLSPAQTLSELEETYARDYAAELEHYKRVFLQTAAGHGLTGAQEMEQLLAHDRILDFLVTRMIPRLHRLFHWSAQPLPLPDLGRGEACSDPDTTIQRPHEHQEQTYGLLSTVLDGDMLFLEEWVYRLTAVEAAEVEGQRHVVISFRRKLHAPSASACAHLHEIEQQFQEQLAQLLQEQALAQAAEQTAQLREVKERKERVLRNLGLVQLGSDGSTCLYRNERCGIVRLGANWWVYLDIPEEFVYEDHNEPGAFYKFDPVRLGVRMTYDPSLDLVSFENARVPGARAAFVLTPGYEHMYVDLRNNTICMGSYNWHWWTGNVQLADSICRYLLEAEGTILAGYREETKDTGPVHRLEHFPHRRLTLEEVQRRGLRITNRL